MAWTLRFTQSALKQLARLDRNISDQITRILEEKVAKSANPRAFGKALTGELKGYWRYRIGDYRAICEIKDRDLVILALAAGHRRDIYR
ncbi:MAG TPA: type II toxin-antitoxin system RelE/ParE family toxin [Acidobacteriaceae bacterium]|nr:type II toxin-antitoxin system RelE/ParE family toxin [Acidobacteriaceae bacterium]